MGKNQDHLPVLFYCQSFTNYGTCFGFIIKKIKPGSYSVTTKFLFIGYDNSTGSEIGEYLEGQSARAFFAASGEEAIRIMDKFRIHNVVIALRKQEDFNVLNYINKYYRDTNVIVSASKAINELIVLLNRGKFSLLSQPLKLEDLKQYL